MSVFDDPVMMVLTVMAAGVILLTAGIFVFVPRPRRTQQPRK